MNLRKKKKNNPKPPPPPKKKKKKKKKQDFQRTVPQLTIPMEVCQYEIQKHRDAHKHRHIAMASENIHRRV